MIANMNRRISVIMLLVFFMTGGLLLIYNQNVLGNDQNNPLSLNKNTESRIIEIFYLPHPPVEAVVKKVEAMISEFPKFQINKYSFDDPKGQALSKRYNLKGHIPMAIFIKGKNEFEVNGKKITLENFPKGDAFIPNYEGAWSYEDLKQILQITN